VFYKKEAPFRTTITIGAGRQKEVSEVLS